jgi:hypothetical protein
MAAAFDNALTGEHRQKAATREIDQSQKSESTRRSARYRWDFLMGTTLLRIDLVIEALRQQTICS